MTGHQLLLASLLLASTACHKKVPETTDLSPIDVSTSDTTKRPTNAKEAVEEMRANFQRVHFEYDSSTLEDADRAALMANAKIMMDHTSINIEVQGHCDERGTTEYNLALGDRRAAAVQKVMVAQGVAPSRISIISYGEERPLDASETEVAWSKNRRAEFRMTRTEANITGTVN